jgi:hypothetical protein
MPSGWFPDPHGRYEHRWFNGTAWTADVAADGQRFVDPLGAAPAPRSVGPATDAGHVPSRSGNGSAVAAITLGLFALVTAWAPLFVVVGVVLAVLAVVFGVRGLRRAKEVGSGRGLAIAGIATGSASFPLAIVGVLLSISLFNEVSAFVDPVDHEAEVLSCTIADGELVIEAVLTNRSDAASDFTLYAVVDEPTRVPDLVTELDGVEPGESRTVQLTRPFVRVGDCRARVVVHGPLPYGVEMERVN